MATTFTRPPQRDSWFAPVSIDMVVKVAKTSFFHPFIAWIIPLCFRAQNMMWDAPPMLASIAWAAFISVCWIAGAINRRLAFGLPREVNLDDEVIVITGGASGLGMLVAEVYGMRGASVAVLDVREMENGESRGVTYYKCDVSDKEQVARVAGEIERDVSSHFPALQPHLPPLHRNMSTDSSLNQLGTPTVLINNAAIVVGKPLLEMTVPEIEQSLTTNLLSHFYTLKTFLPALTRSPNGGTVVTLSSVIGHTGAAQLTDYAAAKAGVTALHKSLAAELRVSHPEIRMVLVTPGQISTPLFYGVQTPNAFLAPVVEPVDVAKEIIAAIDNGYSTSIAMPLYARWIDWFNVLPIGVQAVARRVAGVDEGMKTFIGRKGNQSGKNGVLIEPF
jgi:NAD(P)-dependent dehydrogenase (short-subunit alcohol dehydrogenase family)